jgi:chromatin remodeling complex protein RSC6
MMSIHTKMVAKKNAPVVAATPAPASAPAPATPAKGVKGKPAKADAKPEPVKVEATPAASVPAPATEAEAVNPLDTVFAKLATATALFKEIQASLKLIQKSYDRMKKVIDKQEKKKANARTTPSGFAKPTKISDELCAFLGVPKGTEMSRTQVTRSINSYVKQHNLYDPKNRRIILPDAAMKKILTLKPGEELSFFTLQRAIKGHFASSVKA